MKKIKKRLKVVTFLIISAFMLLGCSKDDRFPHLDVNFVVNVLPEGAGTVETVVIPADYGVYGIELTAIPAEGYSFSRWEGSTVCNISNPCTWGVSSAVVSSPYTVRATAVYELIE